MANVYLENITIHEPVADLVALGNIPTLDLEVGVLVFVISEKIFYFWNDSFAWEALENVLAPASSIDQSITIFNGTSGKIIGSSTLVIDSGNIQNVADPILDTDAMNKQYADANYAPITINGDVIGPASSDANSIAVFGDTSGKILDNTGVLIISNVIKQLSDPIDLQDAVTLNYANNTYALIGNPGTGDVTGPGSSIDGNISSFGGTTGKIIQDSGIGTTGGRLTDVVDPVNSQDVVTLSYANNTYVEGPASATAQAIPSFYDTTGKLIQDNELTISGRRIKNSDYPVDDSDLVTLSYANYNFSTNTNSPLIYKTSFKVFQSNSTVLGDDNIIFKDEFILLRYNRDPSTNQFSVQFINTSSSFNQTIGYSLSNHVFNPTLNNTEGYFGGATPNFSTQYYFTSSGSIDSSFLMSGTGEKCNLELVVYTQAQVISYQIDAQITQRSTDHYMNVIISKNILSAGNYFVIPSEITGDVTAGSYPFCFGGLTTNSQYTGYPFTTNAVITGYATQYNATVYPTTLGPLTAILTDNGVEIAGSDITFGIGYEQSTIGNLDVEISAPLLLNIKSTSSTSGPTQYESFRLVLFGYSY